MKTVRRRSGQAFVGLCASLTRGNLDEQAKISLMPTCSEYATAPEPIEW